MNIWLYKVVSLPHTWSLVQWNERPFYSSPITIITAICPYWIQWFYPLHIIVREIIPLRWTTTECIQLRKWKTKRITQPLKENGIKVLENIERYDKRCDTDFMSWNSWHRKSAPHLRTELDFCTSDKPTQQHKFVRIASSSGYISFLLNFTILYYVPARNSLLADAINSYFTKSPKKWCQHLSLCIEIHDKNAKFYCKPCCTSSWAWGAYAHSKCQTASLGFSESVISESGKYWMVESDVTYKLMISMKDGWMSSFMNTINWRAQFISKEGRFFGGERPLIFDATWCWQLDIF